MPQTHDQFPLLELIIEVMAGNSLNIGEVLFVRQARPAIGSTTAKNTLRLITRSLQPEQRLRLLDPWIGGSETLAPRRYGFQLHDLEFLGFDLAKAQDVNVVHQPLLTVSESRQSAYRVIEWPDDLTQETLSINLQGLLYDKVIQGYVDVGTL